MKRWIIILLCLEIMVANSDFENFKKEQEQYLKGFNQEFESYKQAYNEAFNSFSKELSQFWPVQELTSKKTWVEYSKDLKNKKVIDFKNGEIKLETIADNEIEARKKLQELLLQLKKDSTKTAYKNDQIEQKINKKLGKEATNIKDLPIINDAISPKEIEKQRKNLENRELIKKSYKQNTIYQVKIKMPSDYILKKATTYKTLVSKQSRKNQIPSELIFAVIHSESSFNPMARSHIPAFGLMQIVPNSAGKDVRRFLTGSAQSPSSQFLYNANNNILYGATYLHILYYRYLSSIKDPTSRLYCSIAAYNTGAGNVARAFVGRTNIKEASKKINKMTPQEVYAHLSQHLPYAETQKYLSKVSGRLVVYEQFLNQQP